MAEFKLFHKPHRFSTLATVLTLGCLSLFPLVIAWRYPPFLNDDAYISLAFAKNLLNGRGFVFNAPPPVLGTTTPLYTLAVAGIGWLLPHTPLPTIAVFLSACCWLGIGWVFFGFRKEWGLSNWQVIVVDLVIVGSGWISSLGMEAYPFAFLLSLSLSLFFRGSFFSSGLAAGLLFLTRGEGLFVMALTFIAHPLRLWLQREALGKRRIQETLTLLAGFALPVLLWSAYAIPTFGSFLPNTLFAKLAQGHTIYWVPLWRRLVYEWAPTWGKPLAIQGAPWLNIWWGVLLVGFLSALRRKRRWLIFAGWILLYVCGYVLLNVAGYWWYQLPILFVLDLFFSIGLMQLIELALSLIKPKSLALGISILLVGLILTRLNWPNLQEALQARGDPRGEAYLNLSQWFRENTSPSESVAFIEIGYLGYYTDNRVVDLAGLILPEVVPQVAIGNFGWGLWRFEADYFVDLPDFDWAFAMIKADPRFEQHYRPVAILRGPRESDFVIYKRSE